MAKFAFLLLFLVGCALPTPQRVPSSVQSFRFGEVDHQKSSVQIFTSGVRDFYLYLQLRDKNGTAVDCGPEDISLRGKDGKKIIFAFERIEAGRYYLSVSTVSGSEAQLIDLSIQGKFLRERMKLEFNYPDSNHTRMKILKNHGNILTIELRVADSKNSPVELVENPEILLDGAGDIFDLRPLGKGKWQFQVNYPENNQIMYFGIRAQGIHIPNLLRYQHVEK